MKSICLYMQLVYCYISIIGGPLMPVIIDQEKCNGISECPGEGLCIKLCEKGALEEKEDQIVFIAEKCDDCDLCIQNCPSQAILKE